MGPDPRDGSPGGPRRAALLLLVVLLLSGMTAAQPDHGSVPPPSLPQPVRLAVPLYIYPGSAWNEVGQRAGSVGIVVMNPASGPGASQDPAYLAAVQALQAQGIEVLGYVPTGYADGSVPLAQAETWASDYGSWYGVDGIFYDEATDLCNASNVAYYSALYNFTKAQTGVDEVVLNPGTATGSCYGPISDVLVTFEDDLANYTGAYTGAGWTSGYPPSHFWHVVYATAAPFVPTVLRLAHARGAGWVFVTDQGLPNPYGALPSYWGAEGNLTLPLSVGAPVASPAAPSVGLPLLLSATASGGAPPYTYRWNGLPIGCPAVNASQVRCVPSAPGNFTPQVTVSDLVGAYLPSPAVQLHVAPAAPPPGAGDWTTYLAGPQRDGAARNETVLDVQDVANLTLAWNLSTGGNVAAQSAVVGGVVYSGSWDGNETALNASTGRTLWRTFLGVDRYNDCWAPENGVASSATVLGGIVYVGGGANDWYALNASTGAVEWTVPTGLTTNGYYDWSSPLIYGGYAYIGLASLCDNPLVQGELLEVSLANHTVVHTFDVVPPGQVGGTLWSSPAVDPATNLLFLATGNEGQGGQALARAIVALNASTLALVGAYQVPSGVGQDLDFGTTPTVLRNATGHLYVAATEKNGDVYVVNGTDPAAGPAWSYPMTSQTSAAFSSGAFDGLTLYLAAGPTSVGGASCGGSVRAFDPTSWRLLWAYCAGGMVTPALTVADGLVLAGEGRSLVALAASNGTPLFTFRTGNLVQGAPTVSNGCVFFGSSDDQLYALHLPGGTCLPLTATASANITAGTVPLSVGFFAGARGGVAPYRYLWSFGDGATSGAPAPIHTYNATGSFPVVLTVDDAAGGSLQRTLRITVSPTVPPLTAIARGPSSAPCGAGAGFNGTATGGVPPYTWSWDFGDGGGSTLENAVHAYANGGNYTVTLTVRDATGTMALATLTITVGGGSGCLAPLAITASASPPGGPAPLRTLLFSSPTGGVPLYTFAWTFGDGSGGAAATQNTTHTFAHPGTFIARVWVNDSNGASASAPVVIDVGAATPLRVGPTFQVLNVSGACGEGHGPPGLNVTLRAGISGGVAPFLVDWSFGDGTPDGATPNATHDYLGTDPWVAVVTVTDATGGTARANVTVTETGLAFSCPSRNAPGLPLSPLLEGVVLAGALVLLAGLLLVTFRRRRKGPPRTGTDEASPPSSGNGGPAEGAPVTPPAGSEARPASRLDEAPGDPGPSAPEDGTEAQA